MRLAKSRRGIVSEGYRVAVLLIIVARQILCILYDGV